MWPLIHLCPFSLASIARSEDLVTNCPHHFHTRQSCRAWKHLVILHSFIQVFPLICVHVSIFQNICHLRPYFPLCGPCHVHSVYYLWGANVGDKPLSVSKGSVRLKLMFSRLSSSQLKLMGMSLVFQVYRTNPHFWLYNGTAWKVRSPKLFRFIFGHGEFLYHILCQLKRHGCSDKVKWILVGYLSPSEDFCFVLCVETTHFLLCILHMVTGTLFTFLFSQWA